MHEEQDHKLASFSVQLFTTPSLGKIFLRNNGNFILNLITTLEQKLEICKCIGKVFDEPTLNVNSKIVKNRYYFRQLMDIIYLFNLPDIADFVVSHPSHRIFTSLLSIFGLCNEIYYVIRIPPGENHILHDMNDFMWAKLIENQLTKISKFLSVSPLFSGNPESLRAPFTLQFFEKIIEFTMEQQNSLFERISKKFYYKDTQNQKSKVSNTPGSVYSPLNRFFSTVLLHFLRCGGDLSFIFQKYKETSQGNPLSILLEFPLRCSVIGSQVNSRLWVRNGHYFQADVNCYLTSPIDFKFFQLDLFLFRTVSLFISDDSIYNTIIDRFELLPYLSFTPPTPTSWFFLFDIFLLMSK